MIEVVDLGNTALGTIPIEIKIEIGSTDLRIEQLMKIGRGAIIEIDKNLEGSVELKIGNHLIGYGQLDTQNNIFIVRVQEMIQDVDEHHTLFHTSA